MPDESAELARLRSLVHRLEGERDKAFDEARRYQELAKAAQDANGDNSVRIDVQPNPSGKGFRVLGTAPSAVTERELVEAVAAATSLVLNVASEIGQHLPPRPALHDAGSNGRQMTDDHESQEVASVLSKSLKVAGKKARARLTPQDTTDATPEEEP